MQDARSAAGLGELGDAGDETADEVTLREGALHGLRGQGRAGVGEHAARLGPGHDLQDPAGRVDHDQHGACRRREPGVQPLGEGTRGRLGLPDVDGELQAAGGLGGPDRPVELIVLGDLHGCYSCLKAALLQSDFLNRARAHQHDPATAPDVKLVLLGDYIDRGRFGFEGVLRAALKLLVTFPDHVYLIRGNHEFLVRLGEGVVSAVNPAEAVPALAQVAPVGLLEAYRHLFERMPTALLFERTLFVHGGIPRDATLAERYRDLSSLDDALLKFEMMWSDPVQTDIVTSVVTS